MATISDAYVEAIVESFREGMTYLPPEDGTDALQRRLEILGVSGYAIIQDPDILFGFLYGGVRQVLGDLDSVEDALDALDDLLPDFSHKNTPIDTVADLNQAQDALQNIRASLQSVSRVSSSRKQQFETGVNRYLNRLKPTVSASSLAQRPGVEARNEALAHLDTLSVGWDKALEHVPLFTGAVTSWLSSNAATVANRRAMVRVEEELGRIIERVTSADPDRRADNGISDMVHLIVMRDIVSGLKDLVDPTLPKVSSGVFAPTGAGTRAEFLGSVSAPFHITSANDQFEVTMDEVNNQTQTLPHSSKAVITSTVKENYSIAAPTSASVASTVASPYTTTTRTNAADGVTTNGAKYFTSASATFLGTVQVGDYIVFSGTYTGTAYVTAVVDNTTLLLDTAFGASAVAVTYNIYADNRFRIMVDGALQTVALSVGVGVTDATLQGELSAGLTGVSVVLAAGVITITSSTVGSLSRLAVIAGDHQTLLGFPTAASQGIDGNQSLSVRTDTGTQTITIPPGSYTASGLKTAINALATASIWSADDDSGYVQILSATEGQRGWIESAILNAPIGFSVNQRAEGSMVQGTDLVNALNAGDTVDAEYDIVDSLIVEGAGLSTTSGSAVVQDSSVNFTTLQVQVGDVVHILSGADKGYYHVTLVSGSNLTLSAIEWVTAAVSTDTDVQYRIERNLVRVRSETTALTSAVETGTGSANATLGFADSTEVRGKTTTFQVVVGVTPVDVETLGVGDNDAFVSNSPIASSGIESVSGDTITLDEELDNDFMSGDFTITSKSATSFLLMKSGLEAWEVNEKPRLQNADTDLETTIDFVQRAVRNPTPVYVGEAQAELTVLRSVLFDPNDGLYKQLEAFEAFVSDGCKHLLDMLKGEGQTEMIQNMENGNFQSAFSYSQYQGSAEANLSEILRQASKVVPAPETSFVSLAQTTEELEDSNE